MKIKLDSLKIKLNPVSLKMNKPKPTTPPKKYPRSKSAYA